MRQDHALSLCEQFGGAMSRAAVLDTLDGGWLIIGLGPAKSEAQLTKEWHFDPDQPRDAQGRWTIVDNNFNDNAYNQNAQRGANELFEDIGYNGVFHDQVRDEFASELEGMGATVLKEVPIVASDGTQIRADLLFGGPDQTPIIIEVKTGLNPKYTDNQRRAYPQIMVGYAMSYDPRIFSLGLTPGSPLPKIPVWILRQEAPGSGRLISKRIQIM